MQLSREEWKSQPSGTKGILIKCYNGDNGKLVGLDYVLDTGDDDMNDDVRDLKQVASGYFTETYRVVRSNI